jgi:hypothetical protein
LNLFNPKDAQINIYPNPASDLVAVQVNGLNNNTLHVSLSDVHGSILFETKIIPGTTIAYFDTKTIYAGTYFISIESGKNILTRQVIINK